MGLKWMSLILRVLALLFLLDGLLCMARGNVLHYDFVLTETNFTRLCSTKSMLTVNGSFPGPTIQVFRGDTVYVNVHNQGLYGVTIHWHGVRQPRNPWSDGPENITQCPIQPGTNFTYEVIFTTEEGTLWWHAHKTIIIGEWFKGDVMAIIDDALATGGDPNVSDAFTLNGQPGDLYNCSNATTYHLAVEYGKTYLLRIINAAMNEEQFFAIAQHNLTVVGSDGAYLKPITTNYIMITPGQTMDVLLTADQNRSLYYIASTPYVDSTAPFDDTTTTAIIQYNGNYTRPSTIPFPTLPLYNDTLAARNFTIRLRALASKEHPVNVPKNIITRLFLAVSVNQLICPNASCSGPDGNRLSASLNNISFVTPSIAVLQAYYSFYLVGSGFGNFNNATDPANYNLIDPPEVNTIGVLKNGWATIRFFADNPGVWFMHCHLERHASWGMDTVLIVRNGPTNATSIRPPPAYMPPCS
ncbi:hypothetical protein SLA2020_366060 [Shorea laevis]